MSRNNAATECFFYLNLLKVTKCSSCQIWSPKRFKVTASLRINARMFIKFFKVLEAIYLRQAFHRRGHLLEVNIFFVRKKFIRTSRLRIRLVFYNISWSTKFELEGTLWFKRADQNMDFKQYYRDRGSSRISITDL